MRTYSRFIAHIFVASIIAIVFSLGSAWISAWRWPKSQATVSESGLDPECFCRWIIQKNELGERVLVDPMHKDVYFLGESLLTLSVVAEMPPLGHTSTDMPVVQYVPSWTVASQMQLKAVDEWPDVKYWREERYGWPFHCFRQRWCFRKSNGSIILVGGIAVTPTKSRYSVDGTEMGLPCTPVASSLLPQIGVLVITYYIFYQLVVIGRRTIRKARNQCAKCGYSRRGIHGNCPECGSLPR